MNTENFSRKLNRNALNCVMALSLFGLICSSSAEDKHWNGSGTIWNTPGAWSELGTPSAQDNAYVNVPPSILVNANANVGNLYIGNTGTGSVAVGGDAGATLTVTGHVYLGSTSTGDGTLFLGRSGYIVTTGVIAGPGNATIYSDGGFVRPIVSNDDFFQGVSNIIISATHGSIGGANSGMTFNTNGFDITVNSDFYFNSTGAKTSRGIAKIGQGVLTLSGNANLTGGRIDVAAGEMRISGSLAASNASNIVGFDTNQSGTLRILDGGSVRFGGALVGERVGSNGAIIVESGGSYYATGDTIIGGTIGLGTVLIKSGGYFSSARNYLGGSTSAGTGIGVVTIEGGGVFETRGRLDVGTRGSGTIRLIDDATLKATGIVLGRVAGGWGVIEITGTKGATITGTSGSGGIAINQDSAAAGGIVRFMHSDTNYVFASYVRNLIALEHLGTGVTKLTGANAHTNGTVISAGTLQIGNNTATGDITGNITNNSVLAVHRSNAYTLSANISGTGVLVKKGAATTTLTGNNTYTGGNIIEDGILAGAPGKIAGNVATTSTSAFLQLDVASGNGAFASVISGSGGFIKGGAGYLELTGANSYTGNTTVNTGTLKGKIGTGVLNVSSGATFIVADGTVDATLASITGAGTVNLNNANLVFGVASGTQAYTFTGALAGGKNLRKTGDGLLDLGANSLAAALSGTTFVEAGTLKFDNAAQLPGALILGSAGGIGLIEQTSGPWISPLTITGQGGGLSVSSGAQTFTSSVNGSGDFAKGGAGTLDVRGSTMNQTGGTRILGGTLTGDVATIKGNISLANDATVEFFQNTNGTVAGVISGSGNLVKNGSAELTLSNAANNFFGDTTVNSGTLKGYTGIGTLTVASGATYKVADGATNATLANITGLGTVDLNQASLTLSVAAGETETFAFSGNLISANAASRLVKTGAGTVDLQSAVTLGGGVAVQDGTLRLANQALINAPVALGAAGTYGIIEYTGSPSWTHAITLQGMGGGFAVASGSQALATTATISGAGDFYKTGSGALDITGAKMNNTGNTRVLGGTLIGNTATVKGNAAIAASSTLRLHQTTTGTFAGSITGAGALHKTGAGEVVLTSTFNAYGDTFIDEGMLTGRIGAGVLTVNTSGTYKVADGITEFELSGIEGAGTINLNTANLTFNVASGTGQFSFTGDLAGGNQFVKIGAGTLELLSAVDLAQGAAIKDGVVRLADQSFLRAPVVLGSETTYGIIEYTNESAAWQHNISLTGLGGGFEVDTGKTIALASSATVTGAGDFYKTSAGTLDITAAKMNNTGDTHVLGGTLRGSAATIKGNAAVAADATVEFRETGDAVFSGVIDGGGALAKSGAGKLTLTGINTHTGGNLVKGGELIGAVANLPGDAVVESGARITLDQSADATYAGNVSGAGAFAKKGGATLTLTGTHSHTGGTVVEAGTLIGNTDNLQGSIINNAAISYVQDSGTGVFQGSMNGTGALGKLGAGELVIDAQIDVGSVTIEQGALRLLRDVSAGTFRNRGALHIGSALGGGPRSHITINGNYEAGAGAVAHFGIESNGASIVADTLRINGSASGATEIRFEYTTPLPAGQALPTDIVVVTGQNQAGSFFQSKHNGLRLDDGGYVIWEQNASAATGGRWVNAIAPEVSALGGMDSAAILIGKASLDSLGRRLTVARAAEPRKGMTWWMSGLYRHDDVSSRLYDPAIVETTGMQVGGDWSFKGAGGMFAVGVYYDYAKAGMDMPDKIAMTDTESNGFGAYGTFQYGAWHASVIVRKSTEDYTVNVPGAGTIITDGDSLAGSVEIGYATPIEFGWNAEPQLQFTYQRHDISDTRDPYTRPIHITGAGSAELRGGVRFWREYDWGRGVICRPYARGSYLYDFKGRGRIQIFGSDFENYIGGGSGMIDTGAELRLARGLAFNAQFAWIFGGRVESYSGNAGVSYSW